jgi:chromosome partitioning protein
MHLTLYLRPAELPSIRQGHNGGKAASEISFPVIRERAIALALAVANLVQELKKEAAA